MIGNNDSTASIPLQNTTGELPPNSSETPVEHRDLEESHGAASVAVRFPVVGIGASAGGLAAFEAFCSGMPPDTDPGMAFILVQHLAPDHKSMLSELVQRYTRMQVFEVTDGMMVQPNCVYIIPPNRDLSIVRGVLQLLEHTHPHGQRLPIDFFFRTLAQDQREQAICIVLSGTGSDGTQGLRAVKAEGGMVMVQTPESTTYDGMPRSAIATGLVDVVLPPSAMPAQLITYVARAFGTLMPKGSAHAPQSENELGKIFALLRSLTGHDFSLYKEKTVNRRIERRMALHQIDKYDDYLRYLQQNHEEAEALFHDFLIGVTRFFRDPETFETFADRVIPELFADKPDGSSLRIWVPGCSTGEEAYTIAMLLQEYMEKFSRRLRIQVFATDIDKRAIETARSGSYPVAVTADIPQERLTQFFDRDESTGNVCIKKSIRETLVFSEQNIIKDPPISRLDMISCRNLLIYLGSELQKKLMPLFHYALNPGGMLLLGSSETIGDFVDMFTMFDRKARIYKRIDDGFGTHHNRVAGYLVPSSRDGARLPFSQRSGQKMGLRELTEKTFLQHFAPIGALVDEQGNILYVHGRTGMYLEPAPGESGMNILKMAREGLQSDLAAAFHGAVTGRTVVFRSGVRVKTNGDYTMVDVTVRPVTIDARTAGVSSLLLVIFAESPQTDGVATSTVPATGSTPETENSDHHRRITALEHELCVKEEYLQTTVEELNSSNEEMQSINEELQSTNEELETSKEELQSVNEELSTVNTELQAKVADLTRTNNDMNNLLAGTNIGTVFVDNQMCIRRFTPSVTSIINLIPSDVGRPVNHIVSNLIGYDRLMDNIKSVLDTLIPKEDEVQTKAGSRYLLRIQPYRTLENVIEGVVLTFTDITIRYNREQAPV